MTPCGAGCAIGVDGSLWCWGANSLFQQGNGAAADIVEVPRALVKIARTQN